MWEKEKVVSIKTLEDEAKKKLSSLLGRPGGVANKKEITEIIQADKSAVQSAFIDKVNLFKEELTEKYFSAKQTALDDYPIFMAIAEDIGYDATGRNTNNNELTEIGIGKVYCSHQQDRKVIEEKNRDFRFFSFSLKNKKMEKQNEIKIFEYKKVRTLWDAGQEKWYLSIVDVISVLTESPNARKYWSVLKTRLKTEGSQLTTNCSQLKMQSADGKFYLTDVADTEQLFRLIQSISSPKAEPFKLWLAKVAAERLDEMQDPELSIDRALEQYLQLGYSENWINQRLKSIEIRKELTDEWKSKGLKEGVQFATLTDIITKAWADKTTKEYKILKGLKKENLRDNMTNTELILNMLAEASTKDISQAVNPKGFEESKTVAKQGGNVAKVAMKELEAKTGKKVVTALNAKAVLTESKTAKKLNPKKPKK